MSGEGAGCRSENGGAAARDTTLDEQSGELGDEIVDFDTGVEFGRLIAEGRTEISGVGLCVAERDVTEAETDVGVQGVQAAATVCDG